MKKYAFLEKLLKDEFKTVGSFGRKSGIPKSSLSMLMSGKYGSNEIEIRRRVTGEIKKLRPDLNLDRLWDVTNEYHLKHIADIGIIKKGFKIVVDVQIAEDGEKTMTSYVEGY